MTDNQLPIPIVTNRLTIRQAVRSDMRSWSALYRSPKVRLYLGGPLKRSAQDWWNGHQPLMKNLDQQLSINLSVSNEFVGVCGFFFNEKKNECEVWLALRAKFWGKAMGAEIISALVKVAFKSLAIKRVNAIINPANHSSLKLFKNLSFTFGNKLASNNWQNCHHIYVLEHCP